MASNVRQAYEIYGISSFEMDTLLFPLACSFLIHKSVMFFYAICRSLEISVSAMAFLH